MSAAAVKLSPLLKSLIAAPHALGSAISSPSKQATTALFDRIRSKGTKGGVGNSTWLTLSTAALVTVNSPQAVCELYDFAAGSSGSVQEKIKTAAIMRETGLKCISFSGIPRTINSLGALRAHLGEDVKKGLSTAGTRQPTTSNVDEITHRGRYLWDAIYEPHSVKLLTKLSESHPDLPIHILNSHYGALLSDPKALDNSEGSDGHYKIGRVLTSVVAIACLRAQRGVGPQVTSHVFGLKKALLEGGGADGEKELKGQDWLTSDEGVTWLLESVDEISEVVAKGQTTFAGPTGGTKAKL